MKINYKANNYFFWILLSLILNGIYFWLQVYLNYDKNQPLLGHYTRDSHEYYHSIEKFFANGIYSPDNRMPGLGIIYLLFRPLFEKTVVLNIILVLQWIFSAISTYLLALTVSKAIKKESVFYFIFFLITLSNFIFLWSAFLLTESFCITFFIFSLYYLNRFFEAGFKKYLFWCGVFLTWCVFLRPVFFLFYGTAGLFLLLHFLKEKANYKTILVSCALFFSAFIVFDSAWIIRNYVVKQKFIFLNDIDSYSVVNSSTPDPAVYLFLEAWGGDLENDIHWFEIDNYVDYHNRDTVLPNHMYTSQFNKDSLILVKERIQFYKRHPNDSIVQLLNSSLQKYTQSIKDEKPYLYYVGSGFIYLNKLLFKGYGYSNSFHKKQEEISVFKKIYRIGISSLFYIIFFTGALYSLWYLTNKKKNYFMLFILSVGFSNLIYIAFFFRTPEFRYILPSTLVFMCTAAIVFDVAWNFLKNKITSAKQ